MTPITTIVTSPADFVPMLKPGETRIYICPDSGITVKVFAIMGGGFSRCDVRGPRGELLADLGGTWMYESRALAEAQRVARCLEIDALERLAAA